MNDSKNQVAEIQYKVILELLLKNRDYVKAKDACIEKFGYSEEIADHAIQCAIDEICRIGNYDPRVERGVAITRLNRIYEKAVTEGKASVALDAQKELNRLTGIYPTSNGIDTEGESIDELADLRGSLVQTLALRESENRPTRELVRLLIYKAQDDRQDNSRVQKGTAGRGKTKPRKVTDRSRHLPDTARPKLEKAKRV